MVRRALYRPANRCIYCNQTDGLSDEHIVPLSLTMKGHNFLFPSASCSECRDMTSAFERQIARGVLQPLRMIMGLKSRRRDERPSKVEMLIGSHKNSAGGWDRLPDKEPLRMMVDYADLPMVIIDLILPPADLNRKSDAIINVKANYIVYPAKAKKFENHYGTRYGLSFSQKDIDAYYRLLAKIAFSFTVAEIGRDAFDPVVLGIIDGSDTNGARYVGTGPWNGHSPEALGDPKQNLWLCITKDYICVFIKLFGLESKIHHVLVGKQIISSDEIVARASEQTVDRSSKRSVLMILGPENKITVRVCD